MIIVGVASAALESLAKSNSSAVDVTNKTDSITTSTTTVAPLPSNTSYLNITVSVTPDPEDVDNGLVETAVIEASKPRVDYPIPG
jgi:hypothetical protein